MRRASDEPVEKRRGHERGHNRHDDESGEESFGNDAALQTDVDDDQLHQSARVHQRADAERFAIRNAGGLAGSATLAWIGNQLRT